MNKNAHFVFDHSIPSYAYLVHVLKDQIAPIPKLPDIQQHNHAPKSEMDEETVFVADHYFAERDQRYAHGFPWPLGSNQLSIRSGLVFYLLNGAKPPEWFHTKFVEQRNLERAGVSSPVMLTIDQAIEYLRLLHQIWNATVEKFGGALAEMIFEDEIDRLPEAIFSAIHSRTAG